MRKSHKKVLSSWKESKTPIKKGQSFTKAIEEHDKKSSKEKQEKPTG